MGASLAHHGDRCCAGPDGRPIQAVLEAGHQEITEVGPSGGESSLGPVAEDCKLLWDLEFHGLLGCLVPLQGDSSCANRIYSAEHSQPPLLSPGYPLRNLQLQAALG